MVGRAAAGHDRTIAYRTASRRDRCPTDAVRDWHLPKERAEGCEGEYNQFDHAFRTLILPYLDTERLQQARTRRWLHFEAQK